MATQPQEDKNSFSSNFSVSAELHNLTASWGQFASFFTDQFSTIGSQTNQSLLSFGQALLGKTTEEYMADAPTPHLALAKYPIRPRGPANSSTDTIAQNSENPIIPKVLGEQTNQPTAQTSNSGFSLAYIDQVISQKFNQLLSQGLFTGPKGDKGDSALAPGFSGPNGMVQNGNGQTTSVIGGTPIVSYIPASQGNGNYTGGSLAGFTNLSGQNLVANTENVTGNLTVQGSSLFGSATFSGSASVAGTFSAATSTFSTLAVSGPATFTGSTTIAGLTVTGFNPGFTSGSVVFQGASALSQDNANLFYDATNHRLGIGTTAPSTSLQVVGANQSDVVRIENPQGGFRFIPYQILVNGIGSQLLNLNYLQSYNSDNTASQPLVLSGRNGGPLPSFNLLATDSFVTGNVRIGPNGLINTWPTPTLSDPFEVQNSSGTSLFDVKSGGNVGIGTTTPGAKLQVMGDIAISAGQGFYLNAYYNSGLGGFTPILTGYSALISQDNSTGTLDFWTSPSSIAAGSLTTRAIKMVLDKSGNVGIGTTSPAGQLQVYASSTNYMLYNQGTITVRSDNNSSPPTITLQNNAGTGLGNLDFYTYGTQTVPTLRWQGADVGNYTGSHIFYTATPGSPNQPLVERMRIGSIVLISASSSLEVTSGPNTGSVLWPSVIRNSANDTPTGYGVGLKLKLSTDSGSTEPRKWVGLAAVAGTSFANRVDFAIYTQGSDVGGGPTTDPTEKMRITGTGNVGIGTTNPDQLLTLSGTATNLLKLYDPTSADTGRSLQIIFTHNSPATSGPRNYAVIGAAVTGSGTGDIYFAPGTAGALNEKMRITSVGNVGIGTTTPSSRLEIVGSPTDGSLINGITLSGLSTYEKKGRIGENYNGLYIGNNQQYIGNAWVRDSATGGSLILLDTAVHLFTGGTTGQTTERVTILDGGNVGIGTTSPAVKLQVMGSVLFSGPSHSTSTAVDGELYYDTTAHAYEYFYAPSSTYLSLGAGSISYTGTLWNQSGSNIYYSNAGGSVAVNASTSASNLGVYGNASIGQSYQGTAAPANGLIVQGNVGIGTMGPLAKLEVGGVMSTTGPTATDKGIFQVSAINNSVGLNIGNYSTTPYAMWIQSMNNQSGQTATFPLVLQPNGGNVGIGTTSPLAKLHVSGTGAEEIRLTSTSASSGDFSFGTGWSSGGGIGALYLYDNANSATRIVVNSTGNVGIGTTGPTQKLDVAGNIALPNTVDSTTGVIYKGTNRFIHNFNLAGTDGFNTFVGINAGNFTMTGSVGGQGSYNTGVGQSALASNTTGYSNTANGVSALRSNTTGSQNTANGVNALNDLNILDGTGNNTALGYNTGRGIITGINNTILGANVTGLAAGLSNNIIIADGSGNQRINVLANGNVGIGTTTPTLGPLTMASGAYVSAGGVWTNASDRNLKENFASLTPADILQKIDQLSVTEWNYKSEDPSIKHIGPVAQDFYTVFGLGNNNTSISTIDPAGVALLGIQALDQKIAALQGELTGNATTTGELTVYNPGNFSGDSVGEAKILSGQTSVRITFTQPYAYQPIVTFSPVGQSAGAAIAAGAYLTNIDATGFDIQVPVSVTSDITFNWHSFASPSAQLFVSDGTTQNITLVVPTSQQASTLTTPIVVSSSSSTTTPDSTGSTSASTPQILGDSIPQQGSGSSTSTPPVVGPPAPIPTPVTPTPTPDSVTFPTPSPSPTPTPASPPETSSPTPAAPQ